MHEQGGFLRSSPKIILHIDPTLKLPEIPIKEGGGGNVWACTICFFSNKASLENCELCGVRKPLDQTSSSPATLDTKDSSACVVCTFVNHPSMMQCEMCGADLRGEIIPTPTASSTSSTESDAQIRLSFRQGGQSGFLSKVKNAVKEKKWEEKVQVMEPTIAKKRGVGISKSSRKISFGHSFLLTECI